MTAEAAPWRWRSTTARVAATTSASCGGSPAMYSSIVAGAVTPLKLPSAAMAASVGWSRFQIEVADLDAEVQRLRAAGASFRNEIVTGVGGRQILLDEPAGNCVELFEPGP